MAAETLAFKTELKQLLQLIIHSLYSHPDIFLRELISNASDAIDTARFQSLTNQDLLEGDAEWMIRIIPNAADGTLTIADNGIGMSRETIVENLGTIARSGTKAFIESLKAANAQQRPELIGQFGVGFYSAFMVADRVTVISRMAGKPEDAVQWESEGQGEFRIESTTKEKRGTEIILHLKEEGKQFLDPYRLRTLVKKYSDFVEHSIVLVTEKEDKTASEETINARKAIWLRNKSEVKEEEYLEFYKHLTHDHDKPLKTIHFSAEGQVEFKALLFVPSHRPFDLMWGDSNKGLHLYIQRVFIMDDCEALLPRWLRFLRGVVDSPDLPLNVSRELLQQSAPLEKIKSNLVMKAIASLDEVRRQDPEKYLAFYKDLGVFVKEGAYQDYDHREKVADLLLFDSTKTDAGKLTSLSDYVERMLSEQNEILYLAGESRDILLQSPHLEAYRAKGQEVLLLTDPADEIVIDALREYKGKSFRAIDKGAADAAVDEDAKNKYKPLLELVQSKLPQIKEARLTNRLKESAVCLMAEESAYSANVQRLMQRMGQAAPEPEKRVLELNPEHPLVQAMEALRSRDANDARLETACRLLYDEALIAEGSKVQDPAEFARRLNEVAVRSLQ
ncbi:MAG: molecular chaperone HtpG [Gemmataceae bacterium]|nr:molecular chaperone HtpG [Gemmataceae bacterium]